MRSPLLMPILLALLMPSAGQLFAQARVTGHVFAEVIEMAELRSCALNNFSVRVDTLPLSIDLGSYTISGRGFTTGTIVIQSENLISSSGNSLGFHAAPHTGGTFPVMNDEGQEVVTLSGFLDQSANTPAVGLYTGEYNLVFAYY
jgi:hypothetical protein